MDAWRIALIVCIVLFTTASAILDWRTKKLPNWLTVPSFAAALLFHVASGFVQGGMPGAGQRLLFSLGGFATGFGILFVLWIIGGGGGGDVKFMGALGAWLGPLSTASVFIVSAGIVAVNSVIVLIYQLVTHGFARTRQKHFESPPDRPKKRDKRATDDKVKRRLMPFAIPAAMATWLVLAIWGVR